MKIPNQFYHLVWINFVKLILDLLQFKLVELLGSIYLFQLKKQDFEYNFGVMLNQVVC